MALIKCPECGKEISDKAAACPNCGCPVEAKKVNVHIFRAKKLMSGTAITGRVFIDGNPVGSADNGVDYIVKVSPGSHQLSVECQVGMMLGSRRTESINFTATDRQIEIELKTGMDATSFLVSGTGKIKPQIV